METYPNVADNNTEVCIIHSTRPLLPSFEVKPMIDQVFAIYANQFTSMWRVQIYQGWSKDQFLLRSVRLIIDINTSFFHKLLNNLICTNLENKNQFSKLLSLNCNFAKLIEMTFLKGDGSWLVLIIFTTNPYE